MTVLTEGMDGWRRTINSILEYFIFYSKGKVNPSTLMCGGVLIHLKNLSTTGNKVAKAKEQSVESADIEQG